MFEANSRDGLWFFSALSRYVLINWFVYSMSENYLADPHIDFSLCIPYRTRSSLNQIFKRL